MTHKPNARIIALAFVLAAIPATAPAKDLWLGVYAHDVTPISATEFESGTDLQIGWRGDRISAPRKIGSPAPYVLASANLNGGTNYAAAGLSWRFGGTLYVRPGIGIAVHDGPSFAVRGRKRVDLGSRVLFEPELAAGWQVNDRLSVEASWVHMSHATLFSRQNRGQDNIGARAILRLP
jgi:lipid A 3-O-deacylase